MESIQINKSKISSIIKRNNEIVPFDPDKIIEAIYNAARAVGGSDYDLARNLCNKVISEINKRYHNRSIPAVEELQDIIEKVLIVNGHAKTAKAYILYREQHQRIREAKNIMLDIDRTMDGYLKQSDWRVNENSNVNYSLGGLILHNSGAITANYWLNNIYSKEVADAHKNGDFHLHDLSMFSGYCAGWSLRQLIQEGLGGVKGKINSKPANHLSTLIAQMVNFLGTMQNEWAGAQAFSSFDTYLAPFVKLDKLSYKEVKQNIQSFVFSINTPSRWGSQAPFTNITLDWTTPEDLKGQKAIVGGVEVDFTYGDCQVEMDIVNKAFIEVMMEGDSDGRGFPYPIPTYNVTRSFNWDNENAKLLFEMTAKYGTPYFQNFINSDLDPSDVRSMCCRLQLDKRELKSRGGGLFGADEFTGSIGVVTINLPRIGYLATNKEDFFARLGTLMDTAKTSLETKRKVITSLMDQGLFPYTKRYLKHLNNHFATIGLNGMNESCLNFMSKSIAAPEGKAFAEEVLDFMRKRLADYQEETGNLYNLEATPAEGTSYRLAKIDKERYPDIITSGETDPYYTNSTQLPVNYTADVFEALEHQDSLQKKYTGGTVLHAFLGENISDIETCKNLVKKIAYNFHLPYYTITPTFSICQDHGYISGEHFSCPTCGIESEVYSRIVGYYRPVQNWNKGKKSEYAIRQEFDIPKIEKQEIAMLQPHNVTKEALIKEQLPKLTPINFYPEAEKDNSILENKIQSFKFFYSDTCPNCPSVKEYIEKLAVPGKFFNASQPDGLEEARTNNVMAVPTVIFFDKEGKAINTAHSTVEIEKCL
ncbi:MAG TPA: ribonucleoside triphosphate reductase [Candidatus Margulisbacteria bacterium]|nr:MAG: ribonucleoside triphosphate reductase [Candidatus Margulisbacteria bacterium GWF2_38_17]OGI05804.1 MAG: ribonucleoside triphosphate reductase [Candidatus Margulisbacteria bacterium GWE2_39_32]HCT84328.1 ribonucleoside triphosphate reductase [Candidatus Margulisiibacteriota bacterium]